jgi:hypothetical protein
MIISIVFHFSIFSFQVEAAASYHATVVDSKEKMLTSLSCYATTSSMKGTQTVDTHLYMPLWLLNAVRKLAKQNRRSVTAEITIAVEEYIKRTKNGSKAKGGVK